MIDQTPPELFSQRPAHMEFVQEQYSRAEIARIRSYRIRRIITCSVLVALILGGGYEIYSWNSAPKEIPTIEADSALKQKPEQPGGLDVPNQDVLAYQQLDNSNTKPQAEHLLPPPEQPQAQATPAPASDKPPATTFPMAPKVENFEAPAMDALAPAPVTQQLDKTPAPAAATPPAPAKSQTVEVTPQAAAPVAPDQGDEAPAAPAKSDKSAAKAVSGKSVRIQLASFPDEEEASRQLGRMQEKFVSELGDAKLHLAKADLGSRGIYFRVQSNPISNDDARDICTALKKLKAGCIIVKP